MAEWRALPFSDAVVVNPPVRLQRGEAYPFVAMADVEPTHRSIHSPQERPFLGSGSRFEDGDTLMARIGSCLENGKIGRYRSQGGPRVAHGSTEFIVIRGRAGVTDNQFAYYLTQSNGVRDYAISQMSGTTRQRVPAQSFDYLYVRVPSLDEQRAIAHILGTLDDKIELNRRMNETLEAMARALFRDWFVDFGPTRAKAAGHPPYLAPELWNLFPDALDEENMPVEWGTTPLDEIADFLNGRALQKFPASGHDRSWPAIKIAELRGGITSKSDRASRDVPQKYIVKDGDFLFSWSGSLLAKFWTQGEGALNQHLFKVTSDRFPKWFFSQWVHYHLEEFRAIAASKATTMGHIQRRHLKQAMTVVPPNAVLLLLGQTIGPLVERAIKNELESRTLSETRNLLLPHLISGAIRLRDAKAMAEAI